MNRYLYNILNLKQFHVREVLLNVYYIYLNEVRFNHNYNTLENN